MSGQTTDPFVFGQNDRAEAEDIIERLSLSPHPEGGFYRETFRHQPVHGGRGALTVIYYLLRAGERSAWHRIDAVEVWHHYAGAPLRLSLSEDGVGVRSFTLGKDLVAGQQLHAVVQAHVWQSAESLGRWTLVGCTVAPAFLFSGFELAPAGWAPVRD
jgi:predicted cupin superfamily sugar epimerase